MDRRRPGHGRYAHPEREQRWLLAEVPDGATAWVETTSTFACCDVTDDDRFSGGALATATDEALPVLLVEVERSVATRSGAVGRSLRR